MHVKGVVPARVTLTAYVRRNINLFVELMAIPMATNVKPTASKYINHRMTAIKIK